MVFSLGLLAPTCLRHRLCNGLASLHLSCLSYNPVYFGHGHPHRTHSRLAPDVSHLGHHSVATFIPRSLAVHSLSISFTPQCVTTTAPSSSCFRNIASAFLIISVARQHSGLYKRLHKAQTIHYIKRQKYYHQALCCPLHIVYMTPRHSPPLPADRAYLSIGLASTRGVLVFPPMRVFLDLGTRIVIFSSFLSTFSSTTISRVFPDLSIVFFPSTRLCF